MNIPKIPKFKPLADSSEGTKKVLRPVMGVIIALLVAAFGLEASNNDWNVSKILQGTPVEDAKILRDADGNLLFDRGGSGEFLTSNCKKNLYNCSAFKYREDAIEVFKGCGGVTSDVNRLDGNKDGVPCQELPLKSESLMKKVEKAPAQTPAASMLPVQK